MNIADRTNNSISGYKFVDNGKNKTVRKMHITH